MAPRIKAQPLPAFGQIWTNGKEELGGVVTHRYYIVLETSRYGARCARCNFDGAIFQIPRRKVIVRLVELSRFNGKVTGGHYRHVGQSKFQAITYTLDPRYA